MRGRFAWLAASVVLGIVAARYGAFTPGDAWVVSAGFLAAATVLYVRRARSWVGFLLALAALGAGSAAWYGCRTAHWRSAGLRGLVGEGSRVVRVRGYVWSAARAHRLRGWGGEAEEREGTRFVLAVTERLVAGRWRAAGGLMQVTVDGVLEGVGYGGEVEAVVRARVTEDGEAVVRGRGGDLAAAGIGATGWAPDAEVVWARTDGAGWAVRPGRTAMGLVGRVRGRLGKAVDGGLGGDEAAIVKCLVLGERYALDEDLREAFRRTGTAHFLAVSGLHVGLLAAFVWYLALFCRAGHRTAAGAVMIVVVFYAALAGFSPSVRRAAIMAGVICGGYFFGRKPHLGSSVALALTLILLHRPAELFGAGLQLSFAAVCGIVLFARPLHGVLFRAPDAVERLQAVEERGWRQRVAVFGAQRLLAVSLAAWLAVLPLTLLYFHMVSLVAPLMNLALVPAVWLVLAAGFPGAALAAVAGKWAYVLLALSAAGAGVMGWLVRLVARVECVVLYLPPPGWWWVGLCYAVMAAVAARGFLRLNRCRVVMLMLAPALAYLGLVWGTPAPERMRVTAVSVGYGNCLLVQFPDGKTLLFDAGSMGIERVGERVIAPALWRQGVRRLDAVVLSHHDADHYNGFLQVAERIPVGKVCLPFCFDRHGSSAEFMGALAAGGWAVERVGAGDRVAGFAGAEVRVLWPERGLGFARRLTDNELCCVVHITHTDGTALLTGDIAGRGAALLLSRARGLEADVFQVPHHGRANPEGVRLAAAARPRVGVVSRGGGRWESQEYGKVIKHLLSTEKEGMIEIEASGTGGVYVRTAKRSFAAGARREAMGK